MYTYFCYYKWVHKCLHFLPPTPLSICITHASEQHDLLFSNYLFFPFIVADQERAARSSIMNIQFKKNLEDLNLAV